MSDHGTHSRYSNGCHCTECRAGHAAYRRKQRQAGRVTAYRDAAPARAHILWLGQQGIGVVAVARASGVGITSIRRIVSRKSRHVYTRTHDAILGVTIDDGWLVSAWPLRLLVGTMERFGYKVARVAEAMKMEPQNLRRSLGNEKCRPLTIKKATVIYRYLAGQGIVPASVLEEVA